jgi:hypothetical protein
MAKSVVKEYTKREAKDFLPLGVLHKQEYSPSVCLLSFGKQHQHGSLVMMADSSHLWL